MISFDDAYANGLCYCDRVFQYDRPIRKNLKYKINIIKSHFYDIYYELYLNLYSVKEPQHNYYLSICGIFKNEAPFLKEWIEYHLLIGVNHFYLYNNNSEDNYQQVLDKYIEEGIVTLINWPDIPGQLSSYKHWYENHRHETKWVTFLDLDEFICPRYNNTISTWLKKREKYPVIMAYWRMFGTSGKIDHDYNKLVIEQYINSWDKLDNVGKVFYNTKFDIKDFFVGMMHSIEVTHRGTTIPPINIFGKFVKFNIHRASNKEIDIQINHYWSKSYNAYREKHKRGDASFGESPRNLPYFLWHEQKNNSMDMSIFRYIISLKLKLGICK